jgi:endonuclease YncB( thermonuclease family)
MKSFEFTSPVANSSQWLVLIAVITIALAMTGCDSDVEETIAAQAPTVGAPESLNCPDCELVDVVNVIDANTVETSIGTIQMYGGYVLEQPSECFGLAHERLTVLAGDSIRVEAGPGETIRNDDHHYYLYTVDGESIEEQLVQEGLSLVWAQDGQHLGWFLFLDAQAKKNESGCMWKGWKAFQRGEKSEFRVPGLTYPDSN